MARAPARRGPPAGSTASATGRSTALIRLAYVLTGNQDSAEDLLQTALAKAAARWEGIHSAPEAYVRQVMYREQVSGWRRRARRRRRWTAITGSVVGAAGVAAAAVLVPLTLLSGPYAPGPPYEPGSRRIREHAPAVLVEFRQVARITDKPCPPGSHGLVRNQCFHLTHTGMPTQAQAHEIRHMLGIH